MGTGQLPCSYYHAKHLMRVVKEPLIKKHLAAMPGSLRTLRELAQLAEHNADTFEKHVKSGDIHPHMTERDIRKLAGKSANDAGRTKEQMGRAMLGDPNVESKAKEQFIEDHDNVDRASFAIRALGEHPPA